jgi:hypothetical protein
MAVVVGSTSKHVLAAYLPRCALLPYLVLSVNLLPYWILAYALAFVAIWHMQAPSGNPQLHGPLAFCLFVLSSESASATAPDLSPSTASSTTDQQALLLAFGVRGVGNHQHQQANPLRAAINNQPPS